MKRIALFFLALVLTLPVGSARAPAWAQDAGASLSSPRDELPVMGFERQSPAPFDLLDEARRVAEAQQVRIERRVVIRISPAPERAQATALGALPHRPLAGAFEVADHGDCVAVADIVGVEPTQGNRLLLFTRRQEVLSATLERGCAARAFYSGFYVERSSDGQLCVARERLQSRTGGNCQVADLHRLVAVAQ